MADQTVRIEDGSGSPEMVALKLWQQLGGYNKQGGDDAPLEFYSKCLRATKGIGEFRQSNTGRID